MTDIQFYNLVKYVISGTTIINNESFIKYIEDCYFDEIELSKDIIYPACFLVPQDSEILNHSQIKYTIKVIIGIGLSDRNERESLFSDATTFTSNLINNLPEEINGIEFPIRIEKGLLFDDEVDGITFNISIIDTIPCNNSDDIVYPTLPFPDGTKNGQLVYWDDITNTYKLTNNITLYEDTFLGSTELFSSRFNSTIDFKTFGGQCFRIDNSINRYGLAIYNQTTGISYGIQTLCSGGGNSTNVAHQIGANNGINNIALKIINGYPIAGSTNYSIYSDSEAQSFFRGNIGISDLAPTEKLSIVGSIKINDGTQAYGKVLTSDVNGKGSWQPIPNKLPDNLMRWVGKWETIQPVMNSFTVGDVVQFENDSVNGLYYCFQNVDYELEVAHYPNEDIENWQPIFEIRKG